MPLNLSNRDQNSGHLFYNRRLRAAITRFSVRMKHDDRKQQAAVVLSLIFVVIGAGWMALLHLIKPAGLVGEAQIIGDRDTGALYAKLDGRLHPALNLTSARLAVGSAVTPTWVTAGEIGKYPTGPAIGIPGAPDRLGVTANPVSAWSICDTAPIRGGGIPQVTAIAGELTLQRRAAPLRPTQAVLARYRGESYLIWGGHRSRIDSADRSMTFNLGLDPGVTHPLELSNALFDALPATEPLVVPRIPEVGAPSRLLPDATVGSVLQTRDAAGAVSGLYLLLPNGIQRITAFVADLVRTADAQGATAPTLIAPDRLIGIPEVHPLDVDYYPSGKLDFVDTAADPVTCVSWLKQSSDPQATVSILSGRGLPVPAAADAQVVRLVRDDRAPDSVEADRILLLPGAANFVATTSAVPTSASRENLYWIAPQGVRYGIDWDQPTLQALGLDATEAVQAPWPMIRVFATGPALNRQSALLARDTVTPGGAVAAVGDGQPPAAG